jgi:hypothetical protein
VAGPLEAIVRQFGGGAFDAVDGEVDDLAAAHIDRTTL